MVKAAGLFLAFIAAAATGMMKSAEIRRRRQLLEEFRDLIAHIATEISYFKEPLPQIFARLAASDNRETAILLRSVMASYRDERAALSLEQMWNQAIDLVYEKSPLTADDISVMKKCGQFLGQKRFPGTAGPIFGCWTVSSPGSFQRRRRISGPKDACTPAWAFPSGWSSPSLYYSGTIKVSGFVKGDSIVGFTKHSAGFCAASAGSVS